MTRAMTARVRPGRGVGVGAATLSAFRDRDRGPECASAVPCSSGECPGANLNVRCQDLSARRASSAVAGRTVGRPGSVVGAFGQCLEVLVRVGPWSSSRSSSSSAGVITRAMAPFAYRWTTPGATSRCTASSVTSTTVGEEPGRGHDLDAGLEVGRHLLLVRIFAPLRGDDQEVEDDRDHEQETTRSDLIIGGSRGSLHAAHGARPLAAVLGPADRSAFARPAQRVRPNRDRIAAGSVQVERGRAGTPAAGARSPRCSQAAGVATRPRGVRASSPSRTRNGSATSSTVSRSSPTATARVDSPTGPPPKRRQQGVEHGPVEPVEARARRPRRAASAARATVAGDHAVGPDLGVVADPAQQPVGDARRAAGAAGDLGGAVRGRASTPSRPAERCSDPLELVGRVELQVAR